MAIDIRTCFYTGPGIVRYRATFLLLSAALFVASCSLSGVQGFALDGAWAAILTEDGLFTVTRNGAHVHFLTGNINTHYPAVFVDHGQTVVFVTNLGEVMAVPAIGGNGVLITSEVASDNRGTLVALPGDMIMFTDERETGRRFIQVIDPVTTEISWQLEGIGEAFVSHDAIRHPASDEDQGWYISPLAFGELMVVLQMEDAPERLFLCSLGSIGLDCDFERSLGRTLSKSDFALLEARVPSDPRSGILTPDGHKLILCTRSWISSERVFAYSLWAMDLDTNLPPELLVDGVPSFPEYSMAPHRSQVAYEAPGDFLNVYDFDTGMIGMVATNAHAPDWR